MALTGVLFVLQMDKNFLAKLAESKPDEQVHALMAFDWEGISLEAMARAFLGRAASLADKAEAGNAGDAGTPGVRANPGTETNSLRANLPGIHHLSLIHI